MQSLFLQYLGEVLQCDIADNKKVLLFLVNVHWMTRIVNNYVAESAVFWLRLRCEQDRRVGQHAGELKVSTIQSDKALVG